MESDLLLLIMGAFGILGFFYSRSNKKNKALEIEKEMRDLTDKSAKRKAEVAEAQDKIDEFEAEIKAGNDENPDEFWKRFLDKDKQ